MLSASRSRVLALAFGHDPVRRSDPGPEPRSHEWLLAAGDGGGTVTVWDLQLKVPRCYGRGSSNAVSLLAFSPDGMTLASAGRWMIQLWDLASGQQLLTIFANNVNSGLAFSPDGRRLAVSKEQGFK